MCVRCLLALFLALVLIFIVTTLTFLKMKQSSPNETKLYAQTQKIRFLNFILTEFYVMLHHTRNSQGRLLEHMES